MTRSGAITTIGPIGFGRVQGLTQQGGNLYGWDLTAGLIQIDATTGVGTDVDPPAAAAVARQLPRHRRLHRLRLT